jgi:hypothetical protein
MVGLPCLEGRCATQEHCETNEQTDPYEPELKWRGCPAKRTMERHDIRQALLLRGSAAMAPLDGWPVKYTAGPAMTWMQIQADRQERDRIAMENHHG